MFFTLQKRHCTSEVTIHHASKHYGQDHWCRRIIMLLHNISQETEKEHQYNIKDSVIAGKTSNYTKNSDDRKQYPLWNENQFT